MSVKGSLPAHASTLLKEILQESNPILDGSADGLERSALPTSKHSAGIWKQRDFPPPVGSRSKAFLLSSRRCLMTCNYRVTRWERSGRASATHLFLRELEVVVSKSGLEYLACSLHLMCRVSKHATSRGARRRDVFVYHPPLSRGMSNVTENSEPHRRPEIWGAHARMMSLLESCYKPATVK